MTMFAGMVLHPGGILAWIAVGLIAGWCAAKAMSGGGYGLVGDLILGLVGALVGGFLFGLLTSGDAGDMAGTGFWGSMLVAFLGACVFLGGVRYLGLGRRS